MWFWEWKLTKTIIWTETAKPGDSAIPKVNRLLHGKNIYLRAGMWELQSQRTETPDGDGQRADTTLRWPAGSGKELRPHTGSPPHGVPIWQIREGTSIWKRLDTFLVL